MVTSDSEYKARVILLGASNLANGAAHAAMLLRYILGSPIQIVVASGYGRSYGQPTNMLGRTLTGILEAGFWAQLNRAPKIPTYALVTDIGNDIFYQVQLATILDWIEHCLDRLNRVDARISIVQLPTAMAVEADPLHFAILAKVLFSRRSLVLEDIKSKVISLSDSISQLAYANGAILIDQPKDWYGLDPIHYRTSRKSEVWWKLLEAWNDQCLIRPEISTFHWLKPYMLTRIPFERTFMGRRQTGTIPQVRFRDGSTVSLY